MANLNKVHESCLPNGEAKRQLVEQIRAVAKEIEFTGYRDTGILALELDHRKIRPLRAHYTPYYGYHKSNPSKWYVKKSSNPSGKLRNFIKKHIPDLLQSKSRADGESRNPKRGSCLCSRCAGGQDGICHVKTSSLAETTLANDAVSTSRVSNDSVSERSKQASCNIRGWSVRQDKKGFYRAYKRIQGKVTSLYLGKSLDGADQKIWEFLQNDRHKLGDENTPEKRFK